MPQDRFGSSLAEQNGVGATSEALMWCRRLRPDYWVDLKRLELGQEGLDRIRKFDHGSDHPCLPRPPVFDSRPHRCNSEFDMPWRPSIGFQSRPSQGGSGSTGGARHGRQWIHLPENPCKLVRRPSPPRGRSRRLQGDEEQRLLRAADSGRSHYLAPLLVLALETGMRRGELLSLRWADVDLSRRVAHLKLTKNGDSRDVPLSTRAVGALQELRRDGTERVLNASPNAVRLAWEHLVARAGIEDLRFHDLRHEAVSRLFEKGLNVIEVSTISGHKELRMLQRYTHLRAEDLVSRLG